MTSSAAPPAIISPSMVVGVARNYDTTPAVKYRDTDLDSLSILSELEQQQQQQGGGVGVGGLARQNSRRGYSLSNRRCSPSNVAVSRRSRTHHHADSADSAEQYSREWQLLAKVVDRIFFWLFVVSSIGALVSMFVSLPHKNLS